MSMRIEPKKMYPEGAVAPDEAILLCGLDWCWFPVHSKGFCLKHYNAVLDGRANPFGDDPNVIKAGKPRCAFDPCERTAVVKGHCATHDNQIKRTGKMWEVKPHIKHTDPKRPGKRLCGECLQWKETEENFYKHNKTGYQNKCKPCMIAYNKAYQEGKKLEQQGVDVG